jgi:superfamily II DNA/RNA helicase
VFKAIGGSKIGKDLERWDKLGGNIMIGTIGRVHDLAIDRSVVSMKNIEYLILDEADRLL